MNTQDVVEHLGIPSSTLRQWTLYDYEKFLSERGKGDTKRHNFEPLDVRILSYANSLKSENKTTDEIVEILEKLQDNEWEGLPEVDTLDDDLSAIEKAINNATILIEEREKTLRYLIATGSLEVQYLRDKLDKSQDEKEKAVQTEREKTQQVQTAYNEALTEFGVAKGRIHELEKRDAKNTRLWLTIVLICAILAVVALAVIAALITLQLTIGS